MRDLLIKKWIPNKIESEKIRLRSISFIWLVSLGTGHYLSPGVEVWAEDFGCDHVIFRRTKAESVVTENL